MKIKKSQFEDIFVIEGQLPGPTLAIMGGVHGDELCGIQAYQWLLNEFLPNLENLSGKLFIIKGNPRACDRGVRKTDIDLNRLFGAPVVTANYETKRVKEIKSIFDQCQALLDLHSTSSPSEPMTCSSNRPATLALCQKLPVNFITVGWEGKVEGKASDDYMEALGKIGITMECGWSQDRYSHEVAKQACQVFLQQMGAINLLPIVSDNSAPILKIIETIYPQSYDFKFKAGVKNFTLIKHGETYASDQEKKFTTEKDVYIVMPSKNIQLEHEVCFLATRHPKASSVSTSQKESDKSLLP